jgi:hypothetical protein
VDRKVPPARRDRKALKGTPERADPRVNRDRKALKAKPDPPARRDLKALQAKTGNSGRRKVSSMTNPALAGFVFSAIDLNQNVYGKKACTCRCRLNIPLSASTDPEIVIFAGVKATTCNGPSAQTAISMSRQR